MERTGTAPLTAPRANSPGDYLLAAKRRAVPAVVVAVGLFVATVAAAFLWPATYRSTGTILIEQQEVPVDLVRSMISSYADQRIQIITQRVMTSENLMRIIERYNLYPEKRRSEPREVLIARIRDGIKFQMISADVVDPRAGRPTKATIAFSVSFDHRSAQLAAKVANELTTLYLNENLESRKKLTDNTATFLTAEADRLNRQITEVDTRLSKFKQEHAGSLPELTGLNMQFMSRAEEELRETDTRIRALDQQIVFLDAQLAQLDPASQIYTSTGTRVLSSADRLKILKSEFARAAAIYAPDHPDVVRMKREIEGLEREVGSIETGSDLARQLRDAQGQLAAARERYAIDHPDVQQLERLVTSIEAMMRTAPLTATATSAHADNPAYIQVNSQREASVNERASLEQKRAGLRARIADFETKLSAAPEIEREYGGLVRDLDNAQLKYREIRQKQMEATLAMNLESERKGERFTLIEPPFVAGEPASPNRGVILALGIILALATGIGMVVLLEVLDTSIRGKRDVEALLAVAPLAVLPWIETRAERAAHVRLQRLSLGGAVASVALAITLTHFLYRPLDVLWQIALRRLMG